MINLEDDKLKVEDPGPICYRTVWRRRGSDIIMSVSADKALIFFSRKNHRTKQYKHFKHEAMQIAQARDAIKAWVKEGKYTLVAAGKADKVDDPLTEDDKATAETTAETTAELGE